HRALLSSPTRRSSDLISCSGPMTRSPLGQILAPRSPMSRDPICASSTCWKTSALEDARVLVDADDYYASFVRAALSARRYLYLTDRKSTRLNSSHVKI